MESRAESDLVKLARLGDKNAFGLLVEHYRQMAQRLAVGKIHNENIARELVQEAMLQAYLSLKHLKDDERFRSWFYGIVLNVCRSYLRDQKIDFFSWEAMMGGIRAPAASLLGIQPTVQEIAEARELQRLIIQAIEALSPKNREVMLLFYYEGLDLQEIATLLGISVTAVKGRLHKSRKQLKKSLMPLYLEISQIKQRSKPMIKVKVADVIIEKDETSAPEKQAEWTIVILLDEEGRRVLPIWVGPFEGRAIAAGVQKYAWQRPVTFNFMANLVQAAGVELEQVVVSELKDETFYATAKLRNGEQAEQIDARPSDAIALAVHTGSPIYVTGEVMDKAGIDVSAELAKAPQLGRGLEAIIKEVETSSAQPKKTQEKAPKEQSEEQKRKEKIKALLFDQ